jgi:hypothetical protein
VKCRIVKHIIPSCLYIIFLTEKLGCTEPEYDEFSFFTPDGTVKADDLVATETGSVAQRDSLLGLGGGGDKPEDRKRSLAEPHRNWIISRIRFMNFLILFSSALYLSV